MRLRKRKNAPACEINMASLIDVVFLLIIFFMVVSQVTQSQARFVDLPKAAQGQNAQPSDLKQIVVNVTGDGTLMYFHKAGTLTDFSAMLDEYLSQGPADLLQILIRGDKKTDWKHINELMKVCTDKGIINVKIAVFEPKAQ